LVNLAREERAGVLFVTHDDRLAAFADRTLHLLDGQFTDSVPALL
ncbi:ABC transporter ATP-binding protein, partial [Deinococcus sp. 6GRE01]|nr:ABC transporter ATP-binding protein [Deinococcus sp. 6GRE01]